MLLAVWTFPVKQLLELAEQWLYTVGQGLFCFVVLFEVEAEF